MADVKISELPALTSPDGAEELVVNDGGTTKKITIDNLFNQDIDVTGTVTAGDGHTFGSDGDDNLLITSSAGENLIIASGDDLYLQAGSANRVKVDNSGDISFYEDTGTTAKFFWDASAESLGIGTSSITAGFKLEATGPARIGASAGNDAVELGWSAGSGSGFVQAYDRSASVFRNLTLNNAMTLDNSGNVVVGATAVGGVSSGTKTYITSTGNLYVASSGEEAAYFNRNSNDGSIVEFRKNNATVGSIGTASSKIYIGSGDAGLYFNKDGNAITPVNTTTVADNDAALDLGTTTARFKDLHLSGQVNAATVSATTITGALSGNATSSSSLQQHGNNQNPNNLNNLPLGRTSNYASGGYWQNSPSGMSYGSVYNLGGQVGNYQLSLQIAADVNHNTTSSTKGLWFRTGNNLGFQNDWKEIWHGGNRAGKVLQVVNAKTGSQYSFSSSSGVCGPAVTITPKYSNSKILVMVHTDGVTNTSDANYGAFRIRRGTSVIMNYGYPMGWSSTDNARGSFSPTYLDSPATTSAVTYDTYWQDMNGTTIQINRDGAGYCLSTITVMEIGA